MTNQRLPVTPIIRQSRPDKPGKSGPVNFGRSIPTLRDKKEHLLEPWERAMAQLVAEGLPDRAIAQRTGMTESKVKDRLVVIFRKMAVAGLLDQLLYVGNSDV